mgnify:CR=1 FL=1|tara:strand:+ start:3228 stop:3833 length:606 start_codon:yes stop_codon:yes gene_type:complete
MFYYTIKSEKEEVHVEKKSKFIAYLFSIRDEVDFKETLNDIKRVHTKANHHCWAYIWGDNSELEKCSDDGEPAGAAGLPILGQLKSKELTYCACVVVRYFGGTKLGKGGMIKAYKEAVKKTIESSFIIKEEVREVYCIKCKYIQHNNVIQVIKRNNVDIVFSRIEEDCFFRIECPIKIVDILKNKFKELNVEFDKNLLPNQ